MTPAIVAASASETFAMSLPKNSRAASGTPMIPNDPRCPRLMSFRYSSSTWSFDSRRSSAIDMIHSWNLRVGERSGVRKVFLISCCVSVLAPRMRERPPVAYSHTAPTIPIGSIPG